MWDVVMNGTETRGIIVIGIEKWGITVIGTDNLVVMELVVANGLYVCLGIILGEN